MMDVVNNENASVASDRAAARWERLLSLARASALPRADADLSGEHAAIAQLPRDLPDVIAISVGGSQSKAAVIGRRDGVVCVKAIARRPNPTDPTDWREFFDSLLLADGPVRPTARQGGVPIGVSLAVPITDGVPHHASKSPGIRGLIARRFPEDAARHRFAEQFAQYLTSRQMRSGRVTFSSDAPLAFLGARLVLPGALDGESMQLVCGTGMACADRRGFLLVGMADVLDDRPEHPRLRTEGGQAQYMIAGKGLWDRMRYAVQRAASHPESNLRDFDVEHWFGGPDASAHVGALAAGRDCAPAEAAGRGQFELRQIASRVLREGCEALAELTSAAAVLSGGYSCRDVRVFCEGAIATDPHVRRLTSHSLSILASHDARLPRVVLDASHLTEHIASKREVASQVDLTLIGAAALAWSG